MPGVGSRNGGGDGNTSEGRNESGGINENKKEDLGLIFFTKKYCCR